MGFSLTNDNIGSFNTLQFDLDPAALLLNSYLLPIKTSKCLFLGGYVITSGGTVPLSAGSFEIKGVTTGLTFLRVVVNGLVGLNVLYQFNLQPAQLFSPQNIEDYELTWTYAAGDQNCKVVLVYTEYQ